MQAIPKKCRIECSSIFFGYFLFKYYQYVFRKNRIVIKTINGQNKMQGCYYNQETVLWALLH